MPLKGVAAAAGMLLAVAGCATQDQLRQTEVQSAEQKQAVQALKADAGRSESSIAELRGEIRQTQASVQDLEVALTETRTRADSALATTRDFLANLVAAREEQRRQLSDSGVAFADIGRRLGDLETRLQAQQRVIEQGGTAFNEANRRLIAVEAALVEAGRKSAALETQAKAGLAADASLSRQLQALQREVEETRKVMSSEAMLGLMRNVQGVQRDTAVLRGMLEELEFNQTEAAARGRNQYLDLDTRILTLKQKVQQLEAAPPVSAAVSPGVERAEPLPAAGMEQGVVPAAVNQ